MKRTSLATALLIAMSIAGCGPKAEAPAAPGAKADADKGGGAKPDAAKADAPKVAAPGDKPKGLPVNAEKVRVTRVVDELTAVGSLIAEDSVIIRPELDGRITSLPFQEGQAVKAGAKLVELDSSEYVAQAAQVRADLHTEVQRLKRTRDLSVQGFLSKDALDVQAGTVERLQARLDEVQSRLSKATIRAPFSGIVGLRQVSPGAYVKAGNDIVRLDNLETLKVDFRVPETYLSRLAPNQEVAVRLDAYPGQDFKGRVYATEPAVDERTRTVLLRARIANPDLKLKPGMFVRAAITLASRANAVVVPEQAIWPKGKDSFVFRVIDGKAALTKVQLGNRRPGEVEIVTGLAADDMVVTDGQIKLRDGAPVTVIGANPGGPGSPAGPGPNKG